MADTGVLIDGAHLVRSLDLSLNAGDMLLVTGRPASATTVLLQSLAGLWPFVSGSVRLPSGRQAAMFVPQLPYLPLGDLRVVVSYPNEEGTVGEQQRIAFARILLTRSRGVPR